jgi:plasmid stabilization system protein ParE
VDYGILYTQRALNDLAEIIVDIAEGDADAARFGSSLLDHVDLLATCDTFICQRDSQPSTHLHWLNFRAIVQYKSIASASCRFSMYSPSVCAT